MWVNGSKKVAVTDFVVTSPSGTLGTLCLPITNAQVTFTTAQSGTIEIVGARRPRRTSQLAENRGVTAHDFNQLVSDIIAGDRERWDLKTRMLIGPPGEVITGLPKASSRANGILGFDSTGLIPTMLSASTGLGTVIGPATTVVDNIVTWNSTNGTVVKDSGIAIGGLLTSASSPTLTGNWTFTPTTGDAIHITTPANSTAAPLTISQTLPNSGTVSPTVVLNSITVGSDNFAATNQVWDFVVNHLWGGGNASGQRVGIVSQVTMTTASNSSDGSVAGYFQAGSSVNSGGTNTGAGAKGGAVALNSYCHLLNGATNMSGCVGFESDAGIDTGASSRSRIGVGSASFGNVLGATYDAAYSLWSISGGTGWRNAILLADIGGVGVAPLTNAGCVICTDGSAHTIATGIDLSSYTISGNSFKFPLSVLSQGKLNLGSNSAPSNQLVVTSAVNDGIKITDGTVSGEFFASNLGTHSLQFGALSNHTLFFVTNNTVAGAILTDQSWQFGLNGGVGGKTCYAGSTSGSLCFIVPAAAGTNTITWPAGTTNFSSTGGTSQVVKQTSSGAAFTVAQLAASDLSNGTTGSGSVVLAASPTLTGAPRTAKIYTVSGSSPTCSSTGIGASGTCSLNTTGSSDFAGQVVMSVAGAGPAATGTLTLTFNAAYSGSGVACALLAADNTGSWQGGVTVKQVSNSLSAPTFQWTNVATALTAGSNYVLNYFCAGF